MSTTKFKICYTLKKYFGISSWLFYFTYLKNLSEINKEIKNLKSKKNKQVWTMWLQDEVPEICQICINLIKEYYPNTIVITERNIKDYVDIPDIIWQKYKQKKIIPALFSDYIRMCLLDKYGGLWIDATCFLTQKIPEYIWNSQFFVLKNFEQNGISNYFIYSDSNNYLTKITKIFLENYWLKEDKEPEYFFFHAFIRTVVKHDKKAKDEWKKIPIGLNSNTKLLSMILFDDYDEDTFNWLKTTSFIHKLTYKNIEENNTNPNSYYKYIIRTYKKNSTLQNNFSNQR